MARLVQNHEADAESRHDAEGTLDAVDVLVALDPDDPPGRRKLRDILGKPKTVG